MCMLGVGQGNCMKLDETNLLSTMKDKYSINDHQQSVLELSIICKNYLNDRSPSQVDHDYTYIPNFNSSLNWFSIFKETVISYLAGFIGKILSLPLPPMNFSARVHAVWYPTCWNWPKNGWNSPNSFYVIVILLWSVILYTSFW